MWSLVAATPQATGHLLGPCHHYAPFYPWVVALGTLSILGLVGDPTDFLLLFLSCSFLFYFILFYLFFFFEGVGTFTLYIFRCINMYMIGNKVSEYVTVEPCYIKHLWHFVELVFNMNVCSYTK